MISSEMIGSHCISEVTPDLSDPLHYFFTFACMGCLEFRFFEVPNEDEIAKLVGQWVIISHKNGTTFLDFDRGEESDLP